jgi:hypothetical protein
MDENDFKSIESQVRPDAYKEIMERITDSFATAASETGKVQELRRLREQQPRIEPPDVEIEDA